MEPANLIGFLCNSRLFCHFALFFPTHGNSRTKPSSDCLGNHQKSPCIFAERLVLEHGMQLDLLNLHAKSGGPRAPRSNDISSPCSTANKLLEEMRNDHPSVLGYVAKDFLNGISRHQSRVTRLDKNVIITSTQKNFLKMCLHCDVCCYL